MKPIVLNTIQLDTLRDDGLLHVDGLELRMKETNPIRRLFVETVEGVDGNHNIETFASDSQFRLVDKSDDVWYTGVNLDGLWFIAQMRRGTYTDDPEVEESGSESLSNDERYTKVSFYEFELDGEPTVEDTFIDSVKDRIDGYNTHPVGTAVFGERHHNFEQRLDRALAYHAIE